MFHQLDVAAHYSLSLEYCLLAFLLLIDTVEAHSWLIFFFSVSYQVAIMTTHAPSKEIGGEKPAETQLENVIIDEKHIDGAEKGDYSGAVAKTDPAEIKLVRKLDIRIMTILWAMYFLVRLSPFPPTHAKSVAL